MQTYLGKQSEDSSSSSTKLLHLELNIEPDLKTFVWKLIRNSLSTVQGRKIGTNFDGDCPHYHFKEEIVDHLMKDCNLAKSVLLNIEVNCPNPNKSNLSFFYWIDHVWNNKSCYGKLFHNLL